MLSTKQQRIQIKATQRRIGMSDEDYRDALETNYGVNSCTALTEAQAGQFLNFLNGKATGNKGKYEDLADRPGMASPAQLRMIEAMWHEVSYATDKAAALDKFLQNRFRVSKLTWLPAWKVGKVKAAIEAMKGQPR
jgi:hypothetical protein